FATTPLHDCPALAHALGVGRVLVKDESQRLDLASFKILGASWGTIEAIRTSWLAHEPAPLTLSIVRERIVGGGRALIPATDGNHGRAVARMAGLLGLGCHILVPEGTAEARIEALRSDGAAVDVVAGTYDDAVATSADLADDPAALLVSDTSWPG